MAHFAQLDENNVVIWVTPVDNSIITDENGVEQEALGVQHLLNTIPDAENYTWKQTSYNNNFRNRYAGIGFIYDETLDAFIAPKPFNSWTLNETNLEWEAPTPYPDDGEYYEWGEETLSWLGTSILSTYPDDGKSYFWNGETLSWELSEIQPDQPE
jgi:hypothetical protein